MKRLGAILLVLAAGGVACSSGHKAVATSVPVPAGVTPVTFTRPDLGVTMSVPSSWVAAPATSGFEYTLRDSSLLQGFLLAATQPTPAHPSLGTFARHRATFLHSPLRATVRSRTSTSIDGHGAVMFRYRLPAFLTSGPVDDVEYDINRGNSYTIIVLGQPAPAGKTPVADWIASTIRVMP